MKKEDFSVEEGSLKPQYFWFIEAHLQITKVQKNSLQSQPVVCE